MEEKRERDYGFFEYLLKEDPRVKSIAVIWGCATAMLALCIPLAAVTHSGPILPLFDLVGAVLGTAFVGARIKSGTGATSKALEKEAAASQQHIAELEERLANVEALDRFERRLEEKSLTGQMSGVGDNSLVASGSGQGLPGIVRDDIAPAQNTIYGRRAVES